MIPMRHDGAETARGECLDGTRAHSLAGVDRTFPPTVPYGMIQNSLAKGRNPAHPVGPPRDSPSNAPDMFDELTLSKSAIAYVYKENPTLRREDNLSFYDRVTSSGIDMPSFSFEGGAELVLSRQAQQQKAGLEVRVGIFRGKLRLLIAQTVQQAPVQVTRDNADQVFQAFQAVWQEQVTQPELTEVTLEFTAPSPAGDAISFLRDRVARVNKNAVGHLGRELTGFGLRFMAGPALSVGDDAPDLPLSGADILLRVESLLRDHSQVFFQAQCKWPAFNVPRDSLPGDIQSQVGESVLQVNPKARQPTFYLDQVYDFVTRRVASFLKESGL